MGRFTVQFKSFTYNFTHVKVKEECLPWPRRMDFILKNILPTQTCYREVGINIAIIQLLKLAMSSIQHLSQIEKNSAYIFFFTLNCRKN